MKKLLLCLLAVSMLASCSDSKVKSKKIDDDPAMSEPETKKPKTEDADDPIIVTVSSDGDDLKAETRWSSKDRKKFIRECAQDSPSGLSDEQVTNICSCFLSKAEKNYPSYNKAADEMTADERTEWMGNCVEE